MNYPSRHIRPTAPRPFQLQPRDRQLLHSIYRHRYLLTDHVRQLHFVNTSLRVAQQRLRRLWERRYLDRLFAPLQHDGGVTLSPPLYTLAIAGAQIVGCDINVAWRTIPHTPKASARGFATLQHNLVATDFLVAAECCNTESLKVTTNQEFDLRRMLAQARSRGTWTGSATVPDGTMSLFPRGNNVAVFPRGNAGSSTFCIEVVRAGIRSGNQTLVRKCALYAELHRRGYFRNVFGIEHLRAVLILTTTAQRAEHLRQAVAKLPHGRNLFWFAAYTPPAPGRFTVAITAAHLHGPVWRTAVNAAATIIPKASTVMPN